MKLLDQKIAVVTGANAGIGKAIVQAFSQAGAKVIMLGRSSERLQTAKKELEGLNPEAKLETLIMDMSDPHKIEEGFTQLLSAYGSLDVLVNNAGITKDNLLMKMSSEEWDQVIQTNLNSIFYTCKAAIRPMMKKRKGAILNISSVTALMGNPGQCNYAAAKAGMIGFSKSLAKEIARRGVRVNVLAPGFIETAMTEALGPAFIQEYKAHIPMQRFGSVDEIAQASLFLCSDLANYITGQVLSVDGGLFMA